MSLLLGHSPKLFIRKPVLVRASAGGSSSVVQTPPCYVKGADPCGADHVLLDYSHSMKNRPILIKKAPEELVYNDAEVTTIGSSHGWVASLMHGVGILRLHDDLNPVASDANPKCITLPPLTLPRTGPVSLSSLSPEEEDCVVAVKFMGPQLSYCRPSAQGNSKWFNIRIANPCFFSSRLMFSKRHNMFCIPGSGGQLIASWNLCKDEHTPKIQVLRYVDLPELSEAEREVMDTCFTTEHLVESPFPGMTILVKCFRQTVDGTNLKTKAVMVFKVTPMGRALYTRHLENITIFISKSESFSVRASSFPGVSPNQVYILDDTEIVLFSLDDSTISSSTERVVAPYFLPPQNIEY
uniref:KIB1-4 beta-propeller domain-containing protein n=1 Tax=Brassica oleracea var. oleracea TaxID=109376 RepID=A0A0D3BMT8_BRAOL